jgi:hypothetical protein
MELTTVRHQILETDKKTTIHIILPDRLKKRFKAACVLEGVEMSGVITGMIEDWLDRRARRGGAGDE